MLGEWALSMVGVEEGREFRFRGDLYSQESTFPLVGYWDSYGRIESIRIAELKLDVYRYINFRFGANRG